ncbi:hypothetical protein O181_084701 [Austropuccinia psidii MF-1]|uniref:Tet-like 2OG-Fe(II) oxygenase domain-containing protein n=1 Tax=Austropuccinia psidii MF-1 TaxID=1389203 RepID=A0A9Q3FX04_9BASI|nr:hypothetical protein [Austropuccinia psidii MF-1]
MSQLSLSQLIELPKCMTSLNDEEKHFMQRTISQVVNGFSSSISESLHPITLCKSSLHYTNAKDESFLNSEDHFMGRTISPIVNDYPLSKNDSSSNKKFNHSHRRFQIVQKLLTQILDHASRSRGQFSTVPVKPKSNQKNKLLLLPSRNETSNPSIAFNSKNHEPLFIYHLHPFQNPTTIFTSLNQLIIPLYKLAQNHPHIKSNSDLIDGHMKGVGFRCGSDSGKSLSVYARKTTLNQEKLVADNEEWMTLSRLYNFVSSHIQILSMLASHENNDIIQEAQLPEWHEGEWNPKFHQNLRSFSNVIITTNGFCNRVHQDEKDMNTWTYGLFTLFDRSGIQPIPSHICSCGYGLSSPEYSTLLDFSCKQGIIELLWKTSTTFYQTTEPPPIFVELLTITPFGFSFQINSKLYSRAKSLICMDPITQKEKTYGHQEKIQNENERNKQKKEKLSNI